MLFIAQARGEGGWGAHPRQVCKFRSVTQERHVDGPLRAALLNNRVYIGQAVHKGTAYTGEHEGIVSQALWDKVYGILGESPRKRVASTRAQTSSLLKGLIFGPTGRAMTPTHMRKATSSTATTSRQMH